MDDSKKKISKAVISRLPAYHRYLKEIMDEGTERVSSEELSRRMHFTASQIRQDLNNFGGFGQQGYGYNVKNLHKEIGRILGADRPHNMILLGAGNLGRALVNYRGFAEHGFLFKSAFDTDENIIGKKISGLNILSDNDIKQYVKENEVDIAVITVPKEVAKELTSDLYRCGIRNFWNFAHTELELPADANVKNVHLLDSLLELSFEIGQRSAEDQI